MAPHGVNKGFMVYLVGWQKYESKDDLLNELKMPDILWFTTDERIQRVWEMGMLK